MPRLPELRHCLIYTGAILLIILAVCFSLLRAALPYASGYRADLEQRLSEQLGLRVEIESLDASMDWFTPRLILVNPVVFKKDNVTELIRFDEIELSLAYLDSLRFMSPMLGEINLVGGEIVVKRNADKSWSVQGLRLGGSDEPIPAQLQALLENANYSLTHSHLVLQDDTGEYDSLDLRDVTITVENFLGEHKVAFALLDMEPFAESLQLVVEFDGALQNVAERIRQIYLNAVSADISVWQKRLHLDMPYRVQGEHDIQLWLDLQSKTLTGAVVQLNSHNLSVRHNSQGAASWSADSLQVQLHWQKLNGNWQVYLQDFRFMQGNSGWQQASNMMLEQQGDNLVISADYIQLHDASQLLQALLPPQQNEWRSTLKALQPDGSIYNLHAEYSADNWRQSRLQFVVQDLALDLSSVHAGQPVKWQGVNASVDYSQGVARVLLQSRDMQLALNKMFRYPMHFNRFEAVFNAVIDDNGWRLYADDIVAVNQDIETRTRLRLQQPNDGDLFVDMQSHYRHGQASRAYRYYPVSIMSPDLVQWLDNAIVSGTVTEGGFLMYGKPQQFPFHGDGVMQAEFRVNDVSLQYYPGWPQLESVSARVLFDNASMRIDQVSAKTYRGRVTDTVVRIDDLYHATLTLDGRIRGPAGDFQKYIWNSPLDDILGDAMNQIQLSGNVQLNLALTVPLDTDDPVKSRGEVVLQNTVVTYPELQYRLTQVQGSVLFDDSRVWSKDLTGRLDGQRVDVVISDKPGRDNVTRFAFNGRLKLDSLLQRFDWMPQEWFEGSSEWRMILDVPGSGSTDVISVQAQSDLQGVTVALSDVLQKNAQQPYPLLLEVALEQEGLQLMLDLPDNNAFNAQRSEDGYWHVQADTELLKGEIDFHESMASDTRIVMMLDEVELSQLVRNTGRKSSRSIAPAKIPSLDITTGPLQWRNWHFTGTRLQTSSHRLGMVIDEINMSGRDLQIKGQGSWLTSWRYPHETTLRFTVNSPNFGNALEGLGYQRLIDRSEQSGKLDLKWYAEPYNFSWDKLLGSASFEMDNGEVTDIDPGTGGRILGLLNVFHLPKRLFLSFGDVYKDGFVFDSITGDFTFADGNAETANTEITASAADVRIQGRIGMQAEDYDLVIRVKPKTSAATFTGGALAGGPVVGAGLVLLQKLLGLDKAVQDRYRITGSWDNPVVTQIEKRQSAEPAVVDDEESFEEVDAEPDVVDDEE